MIGPIITTTALVVEMVAIRIMDMAGSLVSPDYTKGMAKAGAPFIVALRDHTRVKDTILENFRTTLLVTLDGNWHGTGVSPAYGDGCDSGYDCYWYGEGDGNGWGVGVDLAQDDTCTLAPSEDWNVDWSCRDP